MDIPNDVIDLIKLREGFEPKTYRDSVGKLTAGWGHLLTALDRQTYPNPGMSVPEDTIEAWFEHDASAAFAEAQKQAAEIGEPRLVNALTSVIFQLGPKWFLPVNQGGHGFVHSWALLLSHKWAEAAAEIQNSAWYKQSPVRVKDFQTALLSLTQPTTPADAIT